jgi:hypothetical protein
MSIAWLAPVALAGLLLAAIPIAIHLLVREQTRRVAFPSLRFLRQSQLAAFRLRSLQDGLLLAVRVAIVCAAALALAGPVVQTPARGAAQAGRVARAVIVDAATDGSAAAAASEGAFVSRIFNRAAIADSIADALRWLDAQPPAAREIVIASAFRRGELSDGVLAAIPQGVGIRFVPVDADAARREFAVPVLTGRDGSLERLDLAVRLDDDATHVADGPRRQMPADTVIILAAPADQLLADAALAAALRAGLRWDDADERVVVAWSGADEAAVARQSAGRTLIRMNVPEPVGAAASAVSAALALETAAPLDRFEPVRIPAERLTTWSRPPGAPPADAPLVDEGDRRWLWALALLLLVIEHRLRRRRDEVSGSPAIEQPAEVRVA